MACMCGDYCCSSCGPAQGNWKCPICREWASEGCKHISPKTNKLYKKYEKQAAEIDRLEAEAEERMAEEWEKENKMIEEYKKDHPGFPIY